MLYSVKLGKKMKVNFIKNWEQETLRISNFIKSEVNRAGFYKVILGLSGGLDSAVTAYLCVKAVHKENVLAVLMPHKISNNKSLEDANIIIEQLGISYIIRDITPMIDAYFNNYELYADNIRRGNKMARERMSILYDLSAKEQRLVIGTGNKTEIYLGYSTIYGDSACAIAPIAHLYKTEVRELAKFLHIPQKIIEKKPSADLWKGQTDEDELGITYKIADGILYYLLNEKLDKEDIIQKGYTERDIDHIINLIKKSEFKRKMPAVILS